MKETPNQLGNPLGVLRPQPKELAFQTSPPLALYVHLPWCAQKCPYCDFNSHTLAAELPEKAYVAALIADLETALPLIWGRRVVSVFIGGGTPSLFSGAAIDQLLAALRSRVDLAPEAEITLEANPGSAESARFAAYRAAGVNRLSLGVQSFDDAKLRALGRIHGAGEARAAIELAARHFDNFNIDLMYGLPQQSLAEALADLDAALAFAPPHLSCYQLTVEANTRFAAQPPPLPEADICAEMGEIIEERLATAGYVHYEISAFARPNRQCLHNMNYWLFGDYLGIGAGAHSKLTLHDRVLRQMRYRQPAQYLQQVNKGEPLQEEHAVAIADLPFEFMLNALRLCDGFDPTLFSARTALSWLEVAGKINAAAAEGLLEVSPRRIAASRQGRRFLNALLQRFLP